VVEQRVVLAGAIDLVWAVLLASWRREESGTGRWDSPPRDVLLDFEVNLAELQPRVRELSPPTRLVIAGDRGSSGARGDGARAGCRWWRLGSMGPLWTELLHGGCAPSDTSRRSPDRASPQGASPEGSSPKGSSPEGSSALGSSAELAITELRRSLSHANAALRLEVQSRQD